MSDGPPPWAYAGPRTTISAMPSVAHVARPGGPGRFVVVDPGADTRVLDDGTVAAARGRLGRAAATLLVAGCAVLLGVALTLDSPTPAAFVLGAAGGAFLGWPLLLIVNAVLDRWSRARAGTRLSSTVEPGDRRAWRLCETAAGLAHCPAWRDGTVDPGRHVPAILWSAVERAKAVEARQVDAERALRHDSLREIAQETLRGIEDELRALDVVQDNLSRVLATATGISRRREQAAREAENERRREAEERELRSRLAGAVPGDGRAEAERQADRSAGLAAEVSVVAELIADADRMLRGTDSPR